MREVANLKLGSLPSNVLGCSGRTMLNAIVAREDSPGRLSVLAQGYAHRKASELLAALRGRITAHHRTRLKLPLDVIEAFEHTLAELNAT
ncbi:hypothetical protein [Burkholderia sp. Bp8986]|uniref:hypothetical protein n=1 Tax=Burkholderia sp. Bp8986 TaxID=2184550 RepID=UPI000F5AC1EB|nr:hypothetical protein [Burkholderia sp. Bp8986]RQS44490.1 hypothetical protein DID99_34200 [Burkholderia sp. Bp8986]